MSQATELIAKQMAAGASIGKIWGTLIYNVKDTAYGAKGDGLADDTTALINAVAAAAVNGGTVVFPPGTYKTGNFTVPSNVTLWFMNGAKLSVNSGATVTINGSIDAGHYQIFSGLGSIVGNPKVSLISPCWFGAKDDNTDCSAALSKAIAFAPSVGAVIEFPVGGWWVLNSTVNVNKSSITIRGQGKTGGTTISVPNMAVGTFNITGYGCMITDLIILGDANATGGYAITIAANNATIDNVEINNTYSGIYVSGGAFTINSVSIDNMKPSFGRCLTINQGVGAEVGFVSKLLIENPSTAQPEVGVFIQAASAVQFVQCEFIHAGRGCWINPTVASVYSTSFTDCYFDNCANEGMLITPNSLGVVKTRIVNCWFSSCGKGLEVRAGNAQGLTLIGCDIYGNAGDGLSLLASANIQYMNIEGCNIAQNGGAGISIAAGISNFMLSNNIVSPTAGYSGNLFGVYINTGASNNYIVQGNIIKGNTNGQLVDGGTGTSKVVTNNITT